MSNELLNKLVEIISRENDGVFGDIDSLEEKELIFKSYLLSCDPNSVDEKFLSLQDEYLKSKTIDVVSFDKADVNKVDFLTVETDMLVVISENLIINEADYLNSDDNRLIFSGGIQIRRDLLRLLEEDKYVKSYTKLYVIKGYNLLCKELAKILVDIRDDEFEAKIYQAIEFLKKICEEKKIKNILFKININEIKNKLIIRNIIKILKKSKIKLKFIDL